MTRNLHNNYLVEHEMINVTGDHTIAAVAGKIIVVTSLILANSVAEDVTIESASVVLGHLDFNTAGDSKIVQHNPDGHWQTGNGVALVISAPSGTIIGSVVYALIDA